MDAFNYFSDVASDYAKYRPGYPPAAIDRMIAGFNPYAKSGVKIIAADVGAGTGIGSRLLAQRGIRVLAIEPNRKMRAVATPDENIRFIEGIAEQLPLSNTSVDLVCSFQAFHWFDFRRSLREFRRILKPAGRLALLWSFWDQRDLFSRHYTRLVYETANRCQRQNPQFRSPMKPNTGGKNWRDRLQYWLFWQGFCLPGFRQLKKYEFIYQQKLDLTGLIGCARSQGFIPPSGVEFDALVAQLRSLYKKWVDLEGQVYLAYRTYLYTAVPSSRMVR